jgi:hypothetical protein
MFIIHRIRFHHIHKDTNNNNFLRDLSSVTLIAVVDILSISSIISSINRMKATHTKFPMKIIARETTIILILQLRPLCWIILTIVITTTMSETIECIRIVIRAIIPIRTHKTQANIKETTLTDSRFSSSVNSRTVLH